MMEESKSFNYELEDFLRKTEVISQEILFQLYDAYSYDTATTYDWLLLKLKVIKERIDKGDTILLVDDNEYINNDNFRKFVKLKFPNIEDDLFES